MCRVFSVNCVVRQRYEHYWDNWLLVLSIRVDWIGPFVFSHAPIFPKPHTVEMNSLVPTGQGFFDSWVVPLGSHLLSRGRALFIHHHTSLQYSCVGDIRIKNILWVCLLESKQCLSLKYTTISLRSRAGFGLPGIPPPWEPPSCSGVSHAIGENLFPVAEIFCPMLNIINDEFELIPSETNKLANWLVVSKCAVFATSCFPHDMLWKILGNRCAKGRDGILSLTQSKTKYIPGDFSTGHRICVHAARGRCRRHALFRCRRFCCLI